MVAIIAVLYESVLDQIGPCCNSLTRTIDSETLVAPPNIYYDQRAESDLQEKKKCNTFYLQLSYAPMPTFRLHLSNGMQLTGLLSNQN